MIERGFYLQSSTPLLGMKTKIWDTRLTLGVTRIHVVVMHRIIVSTILHIKRLFFMQTHTLSF